MWRKPWFFAAAVFALAFAVYWPALHGPFVLDDYDMLEPFSAVRLGEIKPILGSGRPLVLTTFTLNHRLAGGFDPFPFHVTNVLLHALNALLLWGFLRALFHPGRFGPKIEDFRPVLVYGVPLLFLLSPIQTESVAYISSRSELLAGSFYIAGLWVFTALRDTRPWLSATAVLLCFAGAALSKQDKLTLPFAILLLDYAVLSKGDWRGLRKSLPLYGLFGAGIAAGFFVVVKPFLFAESAGFALDWQSYLFTQFRMYFRYLGQLVWPFHLNVDPDIAVSRTIWQHGSWLALAGLLLAAAAAVRYRRRAPLAVFGGVFFVLVLAPTTSFFPLLDYAAERRLYLPAIGFFLAAVWAAARLFEGRRAYVIGALGVLLAFYAAGTYERSIVWSDEFLLWSDAAEKSPEKARPWVWIGRIHNERGRLEEAVSAWERAEAVVERGSHEHAYLLGNLGLARAQMKQYPEAIRLYEQALEIVPRDGRLRAQLAVAQIRAGRDEEGWESFERAFRGAVQPETLKLRGQELFQVGKFADAAADFERALRFNPDDETARQNLEAARRAARNAGQMP